MTYIIPNQSSKQHSQTNKNDISGTIYQSRNINLDESGYIKLAEATYAQYTADDSADFDTADAMYPMENSLYINSGEVFDGTLGVDSLTNHSGDTSRPTPNVEEDVVYFNAQAVVSDGSSVYHSVEGSATWATVSVSGSGFSTSNPTCLTVWDSANTLCVGNSNIVKFINTSWVVNSTILTLPSEYEVFSMVSSGNQLFIATRNKSGGDAKMYVVNSIKTSADSVFSAGTFEIMSVKRFKSSVVIINSLGQLMRFNGGGFDELGALPIYATGIEWADALNDYSVVSNRAMVTDGDLVYINLSSLTQNGRFRVLPNFPSGIWCYDDTIKSLYHKYSPSYTRIQSISGLNVTVNTTDNTFTLTSGNLNSCVTGMPVLFSDGSGTLIPELKQSTCYFLIKSSSTVFKLATSYDNALAGTAIDITGTGNTGQYWYVYKTNDYGWSSYDNRMSVAVLNSQLFNGYFAGRLAYTAELASKQDVSTDRTVFGGVNPFIPNRGYFITPRLNSSNIEEIYNTLYIKFRPLGDDDKIIIKYKASSRKGIPFASKSGNTSTDSIGTWTSTSVFTTTVDMSDVIAGDEIEVTGGVGSGHLAQISTITENAGTYTVTLSEAFPFAVANDQMYFQVDNFTILDTITSTSKNADDCFAEIPILGIKNRSTFVQFKIELRGIATTISEMQVFHKPFRGREALLA